MISAKQAKIMSNNATVNLKKQQKMLEKNKNKEFYIPLPFKLKMVEYLIEQAIYGRKKVKKWKLWAIYMRMVGY